MAPVSQVLHQVHRYDSVATREKIAVYDSAQAVPCYIVTRTKKKRLCKVLETSPRLSRSFTHSFSIFFSICCCWLSLSCPSSELRQQRVH